MNVSTVFSTAKSWTNSAARELYMTDDILTSLQQYYRRPLDYCPTWKESRSMEEIVKHQKVSSRWLQSSPSTELIPMSLISLVYNLSMPPPPQLTQRFFHLTTEPNLQNNSEDRAPRLSCLIDDTTASSKTGS